MALSTTITDAVTAAYSAIGDLAQTVTIRTYAAGSYDPSTGTNTPGASTDTSVDAVISDFLDAQIDGTIIRQGDKRVMARTAIAIATGDECIIDSVTHEIVAVKSVNPGGTTFITILQVRR